MDVATMNSPDVRRNTHREWRPAAATAAAAARGMSVWRRAGTSASSCGGERDVCVSPRGHVGEQLRRRRRRRQQQRLTANAAKPRMRSVKND